MTLRNKSFITFFILTQLILLNLCSDLWGAICKVTKSKNGLKKHTHKKKNKKGKIGAGVRKRTSLVQTSLSKAEGKKTPQKHNNPDYRH